MQPDRPGIGALIRDSVAAPRDVAARLLALRLDRGTALELAVLVSALGALVVGLLGGGAMALPSPDGTEVLVPPLAYALVLLLSLLLFAAAVHLAGRALGGRGSFDQALVIIAWVEVVALAVQAVQLVAILLVPFLAPLVALLGIGVLLWCLLNFVRVLHGFGGFARPVLTLLLGGLGMGIGLAIALTLLGGLGGSPDV